MTDLIDRQAAIDWIKKEMLERDERFFKGLLVANHVIVHLPPAQAFEDTINRKQAIEAFEPEHNKDWYTPTIIEVLEALPPAQPERKTGKWIKLDMHAHIADHKCTACGQECYVPTCMGEPMYVYCPNCGARMDGEANE